MPQFIGSPWTGALVTIAVVLLVLALLRRYRSLERAGTPLPPGVGGARMVGTTGVVVVEHVPGSQRGQVHVLGEDWTIADEVTEPLPVGTPVRVEEVSGTRLVVTGTPSGAAGDEDTNSDTDADTSRRS